MNTTMRQAFIDAKANGLFWKSKLGQAITKAVSRDVGFKSVGKGWNASLSFRTYQTLKSQGCPI